MTLKLGNFLKSQLTYKNQKEVQEVEQSKWREASVLPDVFIVETTATNSPVATQPVPGEPLNF